MCMLKINQLKSLSLADEYKWDDMNITLASLTFQNDLDNVVLGMCMRLCLIRLKIVMLMLEYLIMHCVSHHLLRVIMMNQNMILLMWI